MLVATKNASKISNTFDKKYWVLKANNNMHGKNEKLVNAEKMLLAEVFEGFKPSIMDLIGASILKPNMHLKFQKKKLTSNIGC
jgi:hypothetical protein